MPSCVLIKVVYPILLKESINISLDQRSRIFQNLNGALGEMEEGHSFLLGMQLHADTRNKVVLWLKGLNFRDSCPCSISLCQNSGIYLQFHCNQLGSHCNSLFTWGNAGQVFHFAPPCYFDLQACRVALALGIEAGRDFIASNNTQPCLGLACLSASKLSGMPWKVRSSRILPVSTH